MSQATVERADRILKALGDAYQKLQKWNSMPVTKVQPIVVVMLNGEPEPTYAKCRLEIDPSDPGSGLDAFARRMAKRPEEFCGIGLRTIRDDTPGGHTYIIHQDSPI